MKKRIFSFLLFFTIIGGLTAQNNQKPTRLVINILVDSERSIFVENKKLKQSEVSSWVRNYISKQPAFKYDGVVYQIFGDKTLSMGYIMDVGDELLKGFDPDVRIRRRLLNLRELDINGNNYIEQLERLDLDRIKG